MKVKVINKKIFMELYCLSPREKACLLNLILGRSAKESARILNISFRTVQAYIEKIKNKLACHTRSQLIQKLLEMKIVVVEVVEDEMDEFK